jgi:hypothetical protein
MDIVEFFQQSAGKWSSMRSSHHFTCKHQEGGKSSLEVELLDTTDSLVTQLCAMAKQEPTLARCGVHLTWDGTIEGDPKKQFGKTLLVLLTAAEAPDRGSLLQLRQPTTAAANQVLSGRYLMAPDGELTLVTEHGNWLAQERLWFESANVRLRHRVLKQADGFTLASFCSEVRMGVTKPPAETASTTVAS